MSKEYPSGLYNPEQKMEYLTLLCKDYSEAARQDTFRKFLSIGRFEERFGKDVSKFTKLELVDLFEEGRWVTSFSAFRSILSSYIRWCYLEGYTDKANIERVTTLKRSDFTGKETYDSTWYGSFDELEENIQNFTSAFKNEDRARFDTFIAILYLAWVGIEFDDVTTIKIEDYNADNATIFYNDKIIEIGNNKINEFFRNYVKSTGFMRVFSRSSNMVWTEYKNTTYFLRNTNEEGMMTQKHVLNLLQKMNSPKDAKLTPSKKFNYSKIYWSSIYYQMYEYEQENGELTFSSAALSLFLNSVVYYHKKFSDYKHWRNYFHGEKEN